MRKIGIYAVLSALIAAGFLLFGHQPDPAARCGLAKPLSLGERWELSPTAAAEAGDDFGGACLGEDGDDLVRRIVVERHSRLTVKSEGPEPNLSMALLPGDCTKKPIACGDKPGALDVVVDGGVYHLVVDGPLEGSAVTVTGTTEVRLEDLKPLAPSAKAPLERLAAVGGDCLDKGRKSGFWRLDHAGGPLRLEMRGGVNPGALAVRPSCAEGDGGKAAACVQGDAPTVDLPDLAKGAWCVIAQGEGERTVERVVVAGPGATSKLAVGGTLHFRPGASPPPAEGPACEGAGGAALIGKIELASPAQLVALIEGGEGTMSVVVGAAPVCGTPLPPQLAVDLPAGVHALRVEGASNETYSVSVSAAPAGSASPTPTPLPLPSDPPTKPE